MSPAHIASAIRSRAAFFGDIEKSSLSAGGRIVANDGKSDQLSLRDMGNAAIAALPLRSYLPRNPEVLNSALGV